MAETYTQENFTPSAVPNGFSKDVKDLVKEAIEWGWTLSVRGMTMKLLSPGEQHKNIPLSASGSNVPVSRYRRMVKKHGTKPARKPAMAEALTKAIDKKVEERHVVRTRPHNVLDSRTGKFKYVSKAAVVQVWSDGTEDLICSVPGCGYTSKTANSMGSHYKFHVLRGEAEQSTPEGIAEGQKRYHARKKAEAEGVQPPPEAALRRQPKVEGPMADRHLVSVEPMMSKHGNGGMYESSVAKQQNWSDGTVDYICVVEGCGFVGKSPVSMAGHRKKHTEAGEVEVITPSRKSRPRKTPPKPKVKAPTPVDPVFEALKQGLVGGVDWTDVDSAAESLAKMVREHLPAPAERAEKGSTDAEQTLDAIRALVGRDMGLEEEVELLRHQVEIKDLELNRVKEERDRAKNTLRAFRDLVTQEEEAS